MTKMDPGNIFAPIRTPNFANNFKITKKKCLFRERLGHVFELALLDSWDRLRVTGANKSYKGHIRNLKCLN